MKYYVIKHEDMYLYDVFRLSYRFASDRKRAIRYSDKNDARRDANLLSKLCNDVFRVVKVRAQ